MHDTRSSTRVPRQRRSKNDRISQKVIEYGILGLIIFAPLPAGSVNEWSRLVIALAVLVMLAAYILMNNHPHSNKYLTQAWKWPRILFVGFFAFIIIQILPIPISIVKFLSPGIYAVQNQFSSDFGSMSFLSFSLIPSRTLQQALELLSYFILGFLIVKTITKRAQILRIIYVLLGMGTFQAIYGFFELYNKNPHILFYKKYYYLENVTGTFVNRNHFSGYLEMIIPLALGLIITQIHILSVPGLSWREKLLYLSDRKLASFVLVMLAMVAMSMGLIFSHSRSGIFLLALNFILFIGLTTQYFRAEGQQNVWINRFLTGIFLIIILFALQIGIGSALERFSEDNLLHSARPTYWAKTVDTISDFPLFGTGLGTFTSLFPDWEEGGTPKRLYHAHNDYLEYLSELGIIGMSLLLGGIILVFVKSIMFWRSNRHNKLWAVSLGGLVSLICILVHSITDFNLHIPANMLLFSVVLSLTSVAVFNKPRHSSATDTQL